MGLSTTELRAVSALLDELLALPDAAAQQAWLARLAPEHAALQPLLRQLLDEQHEADATDAALDGLAGLVDAVAARAARTGDALRSGSTTGAALGDAHDAGASGRQIGPYRLLRLLGQGGMGSVWLAERVGEGVQRAVALKLPRLAGAPASFALRFERERDILATLEHPFIARLYEAGTDHRADSGPQPWLAMEYVEGETLTVHCDARRLSLHERVRLFLQVLQAVAFAHARLVVHRDLKPSNILVTAHGQVRLLDFGIAKLLDDDTPEAGGATEMAAAPMTPHYASPEQIARQPIGTASDVYALGVLLFELLAGLRPYRLTRDTRGALEQAILDTEPTRPSRAALTDELAAQRGAHLASLRRQLRGDLDTIILKALKKRPADRYASVAALEEDLQRWLNNEPVRAHPDGWGYRLGKLARRHALPLGAATLAAVALVAGTGVALVQAQRATREARRTQAVQEFLVNLFREADPARAQGRELSVRDLMRRGEADLRTRLGSEPDLQAAVAGALVEIYDALGDDSSALPLAEFRCTLALQGPGPASTEYGDALLAKGRILTGLGRHDQALASLEAARRVLAPHAAQRGDALLEIERSVVDNLEAQGRWRDALAHIRDLQPRLVARFGANSWQDVSARVSWATAHATGGQHAQAAAILHDLEPQLAKPWPEQGYGAAALRADVGYVQWEARAWADAEHSLTRAITDLDRLLGPRNNPAIKSGRTLGMVYMDSGAYARAAATFEANLQRARAFYGPDDGETALNQSFQVLALQRTGRLAEAEAAARESLARAQAQGTFTASELRGFQRRLASALVLNGKAAEALGLLDALQPAELAASQPPDLRHAASQLTRAGALNALNRPVEAIEAARASAAVWALKDTPAGRVGAAKARLTEALIRLRPDGSADADEVGRLLDEASGLLARDQPSDHPDHQLVAWLRSRWLRARGQAQEADRLLASSRAGYRAATGSALPEQQAWVF